jgi:hypothetical protein
MPEPTSVKICHRRLEYLARRLIHELHASLFIYGTLVEGLPLDADCGFAKPVWWRTYARRSLPDSVADISAHGHYPTNGHGP